MIRRTVRNADGAECWALISQVEHARLAGVLAENWGGGAMAALEPRQELLQGIFHHDDGWADWERAAGVDAETGRPLDFTEMPLVESLAIWRDSIASAGALNALAGYMVSAHFCALLRRFSSRWQGNEANTAIAAEFLAREEQRQSEWRKAWGRIAAGSDSAATCETALRFLQLFDAVSLWLCCSEMPEPQTFTPPGSPPISFRMTAKGKATVSPWAFRPAELTLEAAGRTIPAARYESPSALATAPAKPIRLTWELFPAN